MLGIENKVGVDEMMECFATLKLTIFTNSQRTYFQNGCLSATKTKPRNNMNTRKVKHHRNTDTKTGNRELQQNYRFGTASNELLGGGVKPV